MEENMNFDNGSSKNKTIVIIILSLLVVVLGGFVIYDKVLTNKEVIDDRSNEKISSSENSSSSEQELSSVETEVDLNELWTKLNGYWNGTLSSENFIYFLSEDNKKLIEKAEWFTEGDQRGQVIEAIELSKNNYELKIYYPEEKSGVEGENSYKERTIMFYLDLSDYETQRIKWSLQDDYQEYETFEFAGVTQDEAVPTMEEIY